MKFSDIKKFPRSSYRITVEWNSLEEHIERMINRYNADFDPKFQRGHVWTEKQQVDYCEYILRDGISGRDIFCNCPGWLGDVSEDGYVLVDGKQRIEAVRAFLNNKIKVFGGKFSDFSDRLRGTTAYFNWHVASLENEYDVLEWYLNFNSGGTVHTKEELEVVRCMMSNIKTGSHPF